MMLSLCSVMMLSLAFEHLCFPKEAKLVLYNAGTVELHPEYEFNRLTPTGHHCVYKKEAKVECDARFTLIHLPFVYLLNISDKLRLKIKSLTLHYNKRFR